MKASHLRVLRFIQRDLDHQPNRQLIDRIQAQRWRRRGRPLLYRLLDRLGLAHLALVAFAVEGAAQVVPGVPAGARTWVGDRSAHTERHIAHLRQLDPSLVTACTLAPARVSLGFLWRVGLWSVVHPLRQRRQARQLYRLCKTLARRFDYAVAWRLARIVSQDRAHHMVFQSRRPQLVLIQNDHSINTLALGLAAARAGLPIVLVQNAMRAIRPPYPIDLAVLPNRPSAAGYPAGTAIAIIGLEGRARPLRALATPIATLGICLNNVIDPERLVAVFRRLAARLQPGSVLVRRHPNSERALDLATLAGFADSPADLGLDAFADQCDLVVGGNTEAQIKTLRAGCPTIHLGELDAEGFDVYGFVRRRVVPGFRTVEEIDLAQARAQLTAPTWVEAFRQLDGGYLEDQAELAAGFRAQLRAVRAAGGRQ